VRCSFGATRILQLSHQIRNSAAAVGAALFVAFIVPLSFVCLARLFLQAQYGRGSVIGLMSALIESARQHQFSGSGRPPFFSPFTKIEGEQNG
jgi:hypothetical protein